MNTNTTTDTTTDAPDDLVARQAEAMRFAWQLFVEEMNYKEFRALSIEDQIAVAGNAGLDVDGLMRVLTFIGDYNRRRGEALLKYVAQRKAKRLQ